jgi:hypothetical protein
LVSREPRPTTTYTIPKGDREGLLHRLGSIGGIGQPPGPYESWRVKLSDGASQATAILYQSGKLVVAGHAPAFDQAVAIVEAVGKPVARTKPAKATSSARW